MKPEKNQSAFMQRFDVPANATGLLDGLTFAVKDNFDVAGKVTGAGNPVWAAENSPAARHAVAINKLLAAGANLTGKTKMCEFAYGVLGTENPYGMPINPAAPDSIVGGSSSGSASSVASGDVDFSLGTDTACSVRLPASLCGIYGFRPSIGGVSLDGVMGLSPSLDTVGWFAKDMETLSSIAKVMLASSELDTKIPALDAKPPELIVASDVLDLVSPNAKAEFEGLLSSMASDFPINEKIKISVDDGEGLLGMFWYQVWKVEVREAWEMYSGYLLNTDYRSEKFNPKTLAPGASQTEEEKEQNIETFNRLRKAIREKIPEGKVLCMPTCYSEAPLIDADENVHKAFSHASCCLMSIAGLAGLPQVSLPLAKVDGKPLGVSLIGSYQNDLSLLDLATKLNSFFKQN